MPKYRIEGQVYEAATQDEAYAKHAAAKTSAPAVEKKQEPLSAGDVTVGAITNFPSSAWNVVKGMVQPIIAPREFAGGVADLAGNALMKYLPGAGATGEPLPQTSLVQQYAQERYGGTEPLKRTIATDPAGFLADASMLLTGGGSAARQIPQITNRTAGAVSRAGETAERLGRGMDFARYAPSPKPQNPCGTPSYYNITK